MRVIKNKICTDCELIALLDDDNGMELLVNNKIISLDLSVRDVFKKVWQSSNAAAAAADNEPMKIVYRMTGLSGDATEDIIDNFDAKKSKTGVNGTNQEDNDEVVYMLADELAKNDALQVMLDRLSTINETNITIAKPLLSVLLKLFTYATKLAVNRQMLIKSDINAMTTFLQTLNLIFKIEENEANKIGVELTEQLINVIESILAESNSTHSADNDQDQNRVDAQLAKQASSSHDTEQLEFLLNNIKGTWLSVWLVKYKAITIICSTLLIGSFVCKNPNLMESLMRIIPYLSYGSDNKMNSLISYFKPYYKNFAHYNHECNFNETNEHQLNLECFCVIVNGIDANENGNGIDRD